MAEEFWGSSELGLVPALSRTVSIRSQISQGETIRKAHSLARAGRQRQLIWDRNERDGDETRGYSC